MQKRSELRECLETRSGNFNEKQRGFAAESGKVGCRNRFQTFGGE